MPAGRTRPAGREEEGFTLIELLLIVVILGIMTRVGMASYSRALGEMKLDAAAEEIREAFQYARSQSILTDAASGAEFGVWMALPQAGGAGNWLRCVKGNGTPTPETILHPLDKDPYAVDFDETGYLEGVTLTAISLDANNQLYFDRQGVPSPGGTVTVRYGARERTISINRPSGVVAIN